jgi:DNA polymerase III alpha subunit
MFYQEQVIEIFRKLGDFRWGRPTDPPAMSKKKHAEIERSAKTFTRATRCEIFAAL